MCLQVGTTATGHGVILETKEGQDLTLHEGAKCTQSIHVAVNAGAGAVDVAVVVAAATCRRIDTTLVHRSFREQGLVLGLSAQGLNWILECCVVCCVLFHDQDREK